MGNLPNSRTDTFVAGDPVPPNILNELQDMIIGGNYKQVPIFIPPASFQLASGAATRPTHTSGNVDWIFPTGSNVEVNCGLALPVGTIIDDVLWSVLNGDVTIGLFQMTFAGNSASDIQIVSSGGAVIGTFSLAASGTGHFGMALPHTVTDGFSYVLAMLSNAHTPANKLTGVKLLVHR